MICFSCYLTFGPKFTSLGKSNSEKIVIIHLIIFLLGNCGLAGRAAAADPDHEWLDKLRSLGVVPANNTESFGYNDKMHF